MTALSPRYRRFLRYAAVGVSTLLFDLLLLAVLTEVLRVPYYLATPFAFVIASSINYTLSRRHVFSGTERGWKTGYGYFIIVAAIGAFITTSLVVLLVTYLGLYYLVARVLVAGLVGMGNYLFNLYVNFRVVGRHS